MVSGWPNIRCALCCVMYREQLPQPYVALELKKKGGDGGTMGGDEVYTLSPILPSSQSKSAHQTKVPASPSPALKFPALTPDL